ncbi:hypothetical protein [Clostridium paraputrificum]|uniref:hypothetical protein n=2 Tax=Clostridium TaxID=1485 RepID=UPI00189EEF46|nr:hypothetical protein [Clostridium paraputrificum]MDB2094249.1 hypothetical protein [Clostridium paraputrificum]MDB2118410.1 hypothetical protein [Clostridium paraputrificum]
MKSDLRLNFGVLEDIAEKTMKYKESLETVKEVLESVNNKIDENEGKAIDELRKGYKDINEDLDRCLEEVDDIYDIMNRYTDEMQSIITPKKKNDIMRVDRTDIWWNQQSIMEACQSVQFLRWNISTYRSFINPFADDDVVENEENNYNKMKCIWDEINSCGYKLSSYIDEMNRLFNSKIVVFENRDDDYKGEVKSRLYDKYTSGFERFIDVGSDTINFVIDTVRGFSMSIYDMLVGIVNLCKSIICLPGSAVAFVYDKITGEVPDCLKDSYEYEKNFLGGISSVVKDPTLLVEGIAQGVSDAYEEEGIAYCFGYGAGEVAQFVVGSKLASKLKGGKVKASAFGYMDADDALRYNQYWDDVAKGLYNNPYGGKLSLDEISRMQCGFDKIAQKNWEYELGLDRYNNRILDYHNENPINNAIKGVSKADILKNAGLDKIKIDEIVSIPKGTRPDPATYLSKEYMDMHLSQFDDGLSVIQTEWAYGRYSEINGFVGVPDDNTVFVLPKKYCDGVVLRANGDISIIEKELGFPKGYFSDGGGLVRVDVDDVTGLNLRLPSGNETGANSLWIPGGYTSGNVPEAISDIIPLKQATISRINVD